MDVDLEGLFAIAFDVWTLLIAGGIFLGLRSLEKVPWLPSQTWWKMIQPLVPDAAGIGIGLAGWLPACSDKNVAIRIAAGLWCAYVAQKGRKILGQTFLGDDPVISANLARKNGDNGERRRRVA